MPPKTGLYLSQNGVSYHTGVFVLSFWILWVSNGEEKRVYSDQYILTTMDVFPEICIFFTTLTNCMFVGFLLLWW